MAANLMANDEQMGMALSKGEEQVLGKAELAIAKGIQTFWEVGAALATIRDQKLFRGTHDSFELYALERWGMGKSYASRLIGAAGAMANLSEAVVEAMPTAERQVRPLLALPPNGQRIAWQLVLDQVGGANQAKKVTAAMVEEAVQSVARLSAPAPAATATVDVAAESESVVAQEPRTSLVTMEVTERQEDGFSFELIPAVPARVVQERKQAPSVVVAAEMAALIKYWPMIGRIADPLCKEVFCRAADGRIVCTVEGAGWIWPDLLAADSILELDACLTRLTGWGTRSLKALLPLLAEADAAQVDTAVFVELEALADVSPEEGLMLGQYGDHLRQVIQVLDVGKDCNEGLWLVFEWQFSWKKFGNGKFECPWRVWL
jgi:hypothetical protein